MHTQETATTRRSGLAPSASYLVSAGSSLFIFALLSGEFRLWHDHGPVLVPALRYSTLIALLLLGAGLIIWRIGKEPLTASIWGAASVLLFLFITNWSNSIYALFYAQSSRSVLVLGFALSLFALTRSNLRTALNFWLLITSLAAIGSLALSLGSGMLFSDDHPSVLYRLMLLDEHFPNIPHYNPLWNAGLDARDFFATGILNFFFLFLPLIKLFSLSEIYSYLVLLLVFGVVPLAAYLGSKCVSVHSLTPPIAGILALSSSLLWYRWCFKYGSMGFITSCALLLLGLYFVIRMLDKPDEIRRRDVAIAAVLCTLIFQWSLTVVILLPLVPWILLNLRRRIVLLGVALVCLNLPWVVVFVSVSQVARFAALESENVQVEHQVTRGINAQQVKGKTKDLSIQHLRETLQTVAETAHPAILLLAPFGFFYLRSQKIRWMLLAVSCWLLFLGTVVSTFKPQLELERMLVLLLLLWSVPTAAAIAAMIDGIGKSKLRLALVATVTAYLFAALPVIQRTINNRTIEHFTMLDLKQDPLVQAIATHGGAGRTLFSSFILHEFHEGHIAPFVHTIGKPLVASSPTHSVWRYVDVIPLTFRKRGSDGIEEYLEKLNVSAVVAHGKPWKKFFSEHPERYQMKYQGPLFWLYERRQDDPDYFLEGNGEILAQTTNSITLAPSESRVVIKFRHFSFLRSSSCTIRPFPAGEDTVLIELDGCTPGETVVIDSVPAWKRVWQTWQKEEAA